MHKRRVGLYLGVSSVGGVLIEGKKVISLAKFDLLSLEEEAKVEVLDEEIRWEALINRTLREIGAEEKEVYVSLGDKDFIFRSFEIPLMKKKEIEHSLSYEIEKYIPFKMEELVWDYEYTAFPKEKKMSISFLGMREDAFLRSKDIFSRIGIKPLIIEPSSLSLARLLKSLKAFARLKNFALLDFNEFEGYLTFFSYNLPVFNHYIMIPRKEEGINLEKFIESVRLSFQYFRREFKSYDLDKFIIISRMDNEELVSALGEEISTQIEVLNPYHFGIKSPASLENLKALGVAFRDYYPCKFNPVLMKAEEDIEEKVLKVAPLNIGLVSFLIGGGLIFSLILSVFLGDRIDKFKLKSEKEKIIIPPSLEGLSWRKIKEVIEEKEGNVTNLKKLKGTFKRISPFLEKVPSLIPQGLWLERLDLSLKGNKYQGELRGWIFLGDSYKERKGIDTFIITLKNDEISKEMFSDIETVSSQRKKIKDIELTAFTIKFK
jgi:hypothetical protein